MVNIVNLDGCKLSRKNGMYGGAAGNKDGIIYNGDSWLIKYPKNIKHLEGTGGASYSTSPLSEYLGSHVYEILGYDVHETFLGVRNGKIVVACKDFAINKDLLEIRTIKNHANGELAELLERRFGSTRSDHIIDLEELLLHLENNTILRDIPGVVERFWDQAIIDIFINNNDRNNGNWGILRDEYGVDTLAPIFDNGSSFQDKLAECKIEHALEYIEAAMQNAINTQTAYGLHGKVLTSAKFLKLCTEYEGLQDAIIRVVPLIQSKIDEILLFIQDIPETYKDGKSEYLICSVSRKALFSLQLQSRLQNLLLPYYKEAIARNGSQRSSVFTQC